MEGSAPSVEIVVHQVAWLLVAATVIGMLAHWARIPYEIALVLGGLLIEESHVLAVPRLQPALVLLVFLPPLLFDAAFRTELRAARAVSGAVLVLAVPGVLLTAVMVGAIVWTGLGVSLAAGLIHGSYGRQIGMSERTRTLLDELWQYLGFVANGFVFLLVGFSVSVGTLLQNAWPVLLAILAVTLARLVVVWVPPLLIPRRRLVTGVGDRVVLTWGGLRGTLTVALALALPPETPSRELLIAMAFGVVLFTLVVQGLTLPLIIRGAGVARDD